MKHHGRYLSGSVQVAKVLMLKSLVYTGLTVYYNNISIV